MSEGEYRANWLQRIVKRITSSRPGAWFFSHTLHHMDCAVIRLSKGRHTLTAMLGGVPVVTLTTTGARSGRPRTVPLVGIEDGEDVFLIASNWGRARHPAWYHNLRANPEAQVSIRGRARTYVAREAVDAEREVYWRRAVSIYAGYAAYAQRTGGREIRVMVLTPKTG